MTIKELIEKLSAMPQDQEIMILDGFNAGGYPRTINLGPMSHIISKKDAKSNCDCEDRAGEKIVILGYGCY